MSARKKTRIRRKNNGIRKLVLLFILLFIIITLMKIIIPASVTFSRYVYSKVRSYYLNSKEFYFNSDKLSVDTAYFEANNWSGVNPYDITINMNSRKNNLEKSSVNIDYKISFEYSVYKSDGTEYEDSDDLINFSISKPVAQDGYAYGTILTSANNKDYFEISVEPKQNVTFDDNDYVYIKVEADSLSPYKEKLKGEFKIVIGNLGMSYKIEDSEYSPYLEVIVTNTLDYYTVGTAFGTYTAGSSLTIAEYNALSQQDKDNCYSMIITLGFDPDDVVIDTTTKMYLVAASNGDTQDITKDSYDYINQISFKVEAEESRVIKFYKIDASQNYTYPFVTSTPIVNVSYI